MKRVALVAAHFPPSNLAAVHRARLWAQHLHEFGWQPTIVTTHWLYYEEILDWELCELVDPDLEIIRTAALPTKPVRVVGDIGVRAFAWHVAALRRLLRNRKRHGSSARNLLFSRFRKIAKGALSADVCYAHSSRRF